MRLTFFIAACFLGGLGGFLGSVVGAFLGQRGLFVGGLLGGVLIAPLTARMALWRRWIDPPRLWPTTVGAAVGFVAAALVAINTLSTPIGPIFSTALIGAGALVGSWFKR